jgi:hypothetical protein
LLGEMPWEENRGDSYHSDPVFKSGLKCLRSSLRDRAVLLSRTAAHTDCPMYFALLLERNTACGTDCRD